MMRTALYSLVGVLMFGATVQLREKAMDPGFVATPHPLEVARPADLVRATEATGLPMRVGHFRLDLVQRGGNDSRQLIYRNGGSAVSVFATGRRFRKLSPEGNWRAVEIGYGRTGQARPLEDGLTALVWIHQSRRCTAIAALGIEDLRMFVREIGDSTAFPTEG
ncbi:MAG: hypothetical protein ACKO5K_11365 [Armatimonadota bacterium]